MIDKTGFGKVLTTDGIVVLNNVIDVDPRKAVIFESKALALAGINDAAPTFQRIEGLILYYKDERGKTMAGIFEGGTGDVHFKPFIVRLTPFDDLPIL
jgi:hypothetical protein